MENKQEVNIRPIGKRLNRQILWLPALKGLVTAGACGYLDQMEGEDRMSVVALNGIVLVISYIPVVFILKAIARSGKSSPVLFAFVYILLNACFTFTGMLIDSSSTNVYDYLFSKPLLYYYICDNASILISILIIFIIKLKIPITITRRS